MSFSADGNKLAWVGHDSSISVADATRDMATHKLKTQFLPLLSCIWISPNTIIAGGHGCVPLLFNLDGAGQISFVNKLEEVGDFQSLTRLNMLFSPTLPVKAVLCCIAMLSNAMQC